MSQNDHNENNPTSPPRTSIISQKKTELALYTLLSASFAGIFQFFLRSEDKEYGFLLTTVSPSLAVLTTSGILWFLRRYTLITQERDAFNARFQIVEQEYGRAIRDLKREIKKLRADLRRADSESALRLRNQITLYEEKCQQLFLQLVDKRTELSTSPFSDDDNHRS